MFLSPTMVCRSRCKTAAFATDRKRRCNVSQQARTVDAREYYCRTTPVFYAPNGKYDWLNRSVFVATAQRFATSIYLHVYRVG